MITHGLGVQGLTTHGLGGEHWTEEEIIPVVPGGPPTHGGGRRVILVRRPTPWDGKPWDREDDELAVIL
jgi:hypothetical protein